MMRFASLGSGSAGNALVIEHQQTRLLLDCGFGIKETVARIERLDLTVDQLSGILVTHEHDDHAGGVFKLANRFNIPVWLTHGTLQSVERFMPKTRDFEINILNSHESFEIHDIQIQPFPVPHDAREPVQFILSDGQKRLGVLTDTGTSTPHIEAMLDACDALVLECNHDLDMLMNGPYTWSLKQRVSGRLGHLDNLTSADILKKIDTSKLQHIVAAHLSAKNNDPAIVRTLLSESLNCDSSWIAIADQDDGLDWRQIS